MRRKYLCIITTWQFVCISRYMVAYIYVLCCCKNREVVCDFVVFQLQPCDLCGLIKLGDAIRGKGVGVR